MRGQTRTPSLGGLSGCPPHKRGTVDGSESLGREWFRRVWNELDLSAIDVLFAADGTAYGLGEAPIHGPHGFHQFHRNFTDAFRGIGVEVLHEVQQGDMAALHCRVSLAPRSKPTPISFKGCAFIRIRDRQIVEAWNTWDFLSLVQDMGALPPDALGLAMSGRLRPYSSSG